MTCNDCCSLVMSVPKVFGRRTGSYAVTPAPGMQATFQGASLRITGAIAAATFLLRLLQRCRNFLMFFPYLDAKGDFDRCTNSNRQMWILCRNCCCG